MPRLPTIRVIGSQFISTSLAGCDALPDFSSGAAMSAMTPSWTLLSLAETAVMFVTLHPAAVSMCFAQLFSDDSQSSAQDGYAAISVHRLWSSWGTGANCESARHRT